MCNINDNIKEIQQYLNRLLDDKTTVKQADNELISRLPHGIISCFGMYTLKCLGKDLLLAIALEDDTYSPGQVKKQQEIIERITGLITVFAFRNIASYNVQRMIAQRVNFIVPDKLMFIPSMLLYLRPPKGVTSKNDGKIPAIAQCMMLYHLQIMSLNGKTAQDIVDVLGSSYPNINRAIRWLNERGIISLEGMKTKVIRFTFEGKKLWNTIKPMLTNPVERVVYTDGSMSNAYTTGINALAEYSMINPDKECAYAIGKEDYRIRQEKTDREFGETRIEVWRYKPSLLTHSHIVDKLSLYLSLRDNADERIQIELETMINEMKW